MSSLLLIPWFRLEPVVFTLGGREFGFFPFQVSVGVGFITVVVVSALFSRRHGRSVDRTLDLAIHGALFALPFAVLFTLLVYQRDTLLLALSDPREPPTLTFRWSSYGGMIGGFIGALVWKWRTKGSLLELGDAFAFALPFALVVARIGCFCVHDHPGRVSDFVLAVADYQTGLPPYQPRHDLGLYEAIWATLIVALLSFLSRSPRKPGYYVGLVAIVYPTGRFLLDFLRASQAEGGDARYIGLTLGQYVAPVIVVAGATISVYVRRSQVAPS